MVGCRAAETGGSAPALRAPLSVSPMAEDGAGISCSTGAKTTPAMGFSLDTSATRGITSSKPLMNRTTGSARQPVRRDRALVSRIMAAVRSTDTEPERVLALALKRAGLRYRRHVGDLRGRPDFVFVAERVVVFVDGDFWHGRQWKRRRLPSLDRQFARSANRTYWVEKITRNVRRDAAVSRALRRQGWCVVRLWESDLRGNLDRCVARVCRALTRRAA